MADGVPGPSSELFDNSEKGEGGAATTKGSAEAEAEAGKGSRGSHSAGQ